MLFVKAGEVTLLQRIRETFVRVFSDNKMLLKHLLELNVVIGLKFLGSDWF